MNFLEAVKSEKGFKLPEWCDYYFFDSTKCVAFGDCSVTHFTKAEILRNDWMVKPEPEKEYKLEEVKWRKISWDNFHSTARKIDGSLEQWDVNISSRFYIRLHGTDVILLCQNNWGDEIYWRPSPKMVEVEK